MENEWPDDFPLDIHDIYYHLWDSNDHVPDPPVPPRRPVDPGSRQFRPLYNLDLLDRTKPISGISEDYYILRMKWRNRFQQDETGHWDYVQYVPPWTDPDWDERYVYMGPRDHPWPADDVLAQQYAKPGAMQTQRPALRESDAALNPTAAAKRWGIYPYPMDKNTTPRSPPDRASSGLSPTSCIFPPTVALDIPQVTPRGAGVQTAVTVEDLQVVREEYIESMKLRGGVPSDDHFQSCLEGSTFIHEKGSASWDIADKLLKLSNLLAEQEGKLEYQALLFAGNTSDELVQRGIWTMGMDATCDIAEPLNDLVTRETWATTERRGWISYEPRIVYNISGKRGEFTAHNDEIWQALQPALQLVSKILASNHPITWAWADVRKLRPVRDWRCPLSYEETQERITEHTRAAWNVDRHHVFSVWPEFSCREEDMDPATAGWEDLVRLVRGGFDTTRYVCEILKRTIEWDIQPGYRLGEYTNVGDGKPQAVLGLTRIELVETPGADRPFKICTSISADYVWQLLVDEYSPAEKAAVSFAIAATMLHEISHAICLARLQMGAPYRSQNRDPLWLELNPAWKQELKDFGAATGIDVLAALMINGTRHRVGKDTLVSKGLMRPWHETFLENEPRDEEGFASENQYFGGVQENIGNTLPDVFDQLEPSRFLSEMAIIGCLRFWNTDYGDNLRFSITQPIPAEAYLKLFRKDFWEGSFKAYGHDSLKLRAGESLPGMRITTQFSWNMVKQKYGVYAQQWMQNAWERLKGENKTHILWRWLYYKTVLSVEHLEVYQAWKLSYRKWGETDRSMWATARAVKERHALLVTKTMENAGFGAVDDGVVVDIIAQAILAHPENFPDPLMVLVDFRAYFSALRSIIRDLSREVTFNQNIAAAYLRLSDETAKHTIYDRYAYKLRMRIEAIYIGIIDTILGLLEDLDGFNDIITRLLHVTPEIRRMLTEGRSDMRAKLDVIKQNFIMFMSVFCANIEYQKVGMQNLEAVPTSAAKNTASRLERAARWEYNRLPPGCSLKNIADDWMRILITGDALVNPAPDSEGYTFNQALAARNQSINMMTAVQRQAVEVQYPDPQGGIRDPVSDLQSQQPAAGQLNQVRDFTGRQQQSYAAATGYQPFRDPQTGFNRFRQIGRQGKAAANPALEPLLPDGDPTGFLEAMERAIDEKRELINRPSTVNLRQILFGSASALCSQNLHEIESMIRQRDAGRALISWVNNSAQGGEQVTTAAAAAHQHVEIDIQSAHNFIQAMRDFGRGLTGSQGISQGGFAPVDPHTVESFAKLLEGVLRNQTIE